MALIQILIDTPGSWYWPYGRRLAEALRARGHEAVLRRAAAEVVAGDVLCLLSCERLFQALDLNTYNLVVHESALPRGKGWSPLTWQILEGRQEVPVTLFEAAEGVDAGPVYLTETLRFAGHELLPELKHAQGEATNRLILRFLQDFPTVPVARPQVGEETFYPRRRPADSALDVSKALAEQFDLLRVCDNDRYPAYFDFRGHRYTLRIEKTDLPPTP